MVVLAAVMLVATPVLAFAGGLFGHLLSRRSALELDRWRKREETMRMLRWATELALDDGQDQARVGLVALSSLVRSSMLDTDDLEFVGSVSDEVARRSQELDGRSD